MSNNKLKQREYLNNRGLEKNNEITNENKLSYVKVNSFS